MQKHTTPEKNDGGMTKRDIERRSSVSKEERSILVEEADSNMSKVAAEGEQQIIEEQQGDEANQMTMTNANMSQSACEHEECLQEIAREQEERDQLLMKIVSGVREELDIQKKQLSMLINHAKPTPLPPIRVSELTR